MNPCQALKIFIHGGETAYRGKIITQEIRARYSTDVGTGTLGRSAVSYLYHCEENSAVKLAVMRRLRGVEPFGSGMLAIQSCLKDVKEIRKDKKRCHKELVQTEKQQTLLNKKIESYHAGRRCFFQPSLETLTERKRTVDELLIARQAAFNKVADRLDDTHRQLTAHINCGGEQHWRLLFAQHEADRQKLGIHILIPNN